MAIINRLFRSSPSSFERTLNIWPIDRTQSLESCTTRRAWWSLWKAAGWRGAVSFQVGRGPFQCGIPVVSSNPVNFKYAKERRFKREAGCLFAGKSQ